MPITRPHPSNNLPISRPGNQNSSLRVEINQPTTNPKQQTNSPQKIKFRHHRMTRPRSPRSATIRSRPQIRNLPSKRLPPTGTRNPKTISPRPRPSQRAVTPAGLSSRTPHHTHRSRIRTASSRPRILSSPTAPTRPSKRSWVTSPKRCSRGRLLTRRR